MLSESIRTALNKQITDELYASHLYLAMAAYFESQALPGFAHWMRVQSDEERAHALRVIDMVVNRGGDIVIQGIEAPSPRMGKPLAVFENALAHEQEVTQMIHNLYALAEKENDYTTQAELQWFLVEQVEEERVTGDIVQQLKRVQDDPSGLMMLDRELAGRAAEA